MFRVKLDNSVFLCRTADTAIVIFVFSDKQNIFWDTNLREYSIIDKEIVSKIQRR